MYKIVRKGTTFTAYGMTPDTVLSKHKTLDAAEKAFDKVVGRAVLLSPDGKKLNDRII
jgi:hypothetical protein